MRNNKCYTFAIEMFFCLFLLFSGCSEQVPEVKKLKTQPDNQVMIQSEEIPKTVKLALNFTEGQSESYRLQTVAQRKFTLEGPQSENLENSQGGQTTDKIEMVFDQQIQKIDSSGNAVEKITIKELRYFAEIRDREVLDFDSTIDKDPNNALFALTGQSYTIEITPSGMVSKIIDVNKARAAIKNIPSNYEAADRLLRDSTIERNHSIPLPDVNNNELSSGQTWSNVTTFDFGLLGTRSYERDYTLKKIEKAENSLYAVVDMNAIPSVEGTKENYQERGSPTVLPMTDVRQTYNGQMMFNVTDGTLTKYDEDLKNEWLVVPPASGQSGNPISLNMTAIQTYHIEKLK